jgi:hypothetical protein
MFAVDLPFALAMFSSDSATTLATVGLLSTAWFYFIGRIGYDSKKGKIGRVTSGLGTVLIFCVYAVGVRICWEYITEDFRGDVAARYTLIQYVPAVVLLVGAFTSMFYAATSLRKTSTLVG